MKITVVYSPGPCEIDATELDLPPDTSAEEALAASGLLDRYSLLTQGAAPIGIWGRRCRRDARLSPGDRLEIYRPLQIDPKEARRARGRRLRKAQVPAPKTGT